MFVAYHSYLKNPINYGIISSYYEVPGPFKSEFTFFKDDNPFSG